ncbi:hypothetical protein LSUE1_G003403 [Lachnellula suecica]|uniref:Ribosomal RNA methyltransferase FtsJ domain-containing protein n=1 Tax=Lachnellula suecica TaxID=602035 RepID=A0A8T9C8B5_9HELO|nr:hypothetical protein LSUE1_G003403 [Lachnellula suecica]
MSYSTGSAEVEGDGSLLDTPNIWKPRIAGGGLKTPTPAMWKSSFGGEDLQAETSNLDGDGDKLQLEEPSMWRSSLARDGLKTPMPTKWKSSFEGDGPHSETPTEPKANVEDNGLQPGVPTIRKPSDISIDELVKIMEENTILDDPRESRFERSSKLVRAYLIKNEPEFVRVTGYRNRGWTENREQGDEFFKRQRAKADNSDYESEEKFFIMMQQIAEEMNRMTGAFTVPTTYGKDIKTLDICMAPGGYTAAVLKRYPNAKCFGITLPKEQGGHPLHIDRKKLAGLQLLDVTMLVKEFANRPVPVTHPEQQKFLTIQPFKFHSFDLVFCDGMVLRTQKRESHRETTEVTRLACSQLILALQRIKVGGTVVMLLHKIDSFPAANILYTFSKFAKVQAFKPQKKHSTRSSFYMIASKMQPDSEAAKAAVDGWKQGWWKATFGGEAGTGERRENPSDSVVLNMLEEFGEQLVGMGRPVWGIQADALSRTDYAGDKPADLLSGLAIGTTPPLSVRPSPLRDLRENIPPESSTASKSPTKPTLPVDLLQGWKDFA